jgi:hypothetical protein
MLIWGGASKPAFRCGALDIALDRIRIKMEHVMNNFLLLKNIRFSPGDNVPPLK